MLLEEVLQHLHLGLRMRSSYHVIPKQWLGNDGYIEELLLERGNLSECYATSFSNKRTALQSYRISYWSGILRTDDKVCLLSVS